MKICNKKNKAVDLWKKYHKRRSEKNKMALVECYFPFVKMIANRVSESVGWRMQPDELSSYGVEGLYRSIERFDKNAGVKFESYASRRIKGSMLDGIRKEDNVPRTVRMAGERFDRHKQRLENHEKKKLSDADVADMLGMDEQKFQKNFRKYRPLPQVSLDIEMGDTHDDSAHECSIFSVLEDKKVDNPTGKMFRKEILSKLLTNDFTDIEKKIIYFYYYDNLTMNKISKQVGLSESRVSQMHKKILPRLAEKIHRNPEYFSDIYTFIDDCDHNGSIF